jgi:uncharacterized protein YbbC (DUF1343 family)/CubicO group peptidase (beta-lactamase class C family)
MKTIFSIQSRRRCLPWSVLLFVFLNVSSSVAAHPPKLLRADPKSVGMNAGRFSVIDEIVIESIGRGRMPGAVVLVGHRGKIVYFKAFGHKQLKPAKVAMTRDTVFDMASITKPVATATSILKLVEQGKIQLRDPVAKYIPEFAANGKQTISIYQLLTHQGGLIPDNPLKDYNDGPEKAMQRIDALKLIAEPGTRFSYTDVGFIVLARLVKQVSGLDVHRFSQKHFFKPLGMTETGYLPEKSLRDRAATTQQRDNKWMKGEVHDPRAFRLGGIAGHAGLFSTAEDLAVYAQMMLNGGIYHKVRVFDESTVTLMTKAYAVPRGLRGLGWDSRSGFSSNRGDFFSPRAFGHGGFTGTTLWIDPELDLFVIFLSNRVHPDGKGSINTLAGRIGTIASAAIENAKIKIPETSTSIRPPERQVLTGIDVLQQNGFRSLKGRRVGLITNHTGVNRNGVRTAEIIFKHPDVNLIALFSPEHGIAGKLDVPGIKNSSDSATQLKIYSLYGKTRTPTQESLKGLDTLVFDIQDIGTRFYTYISTMGNAMQAAAGNKLRFVVLDRPNPINGIDVAGPVLDTGSESFVGFHQLPVRHGMTAGELARMFDAELKLNLDLHVVRLQGWKRSDFYDATGLSWINPSPNMRNLNEALLYPGIGLLETTNLSVGRGTDTPFELVGAPWIDGVALAEKLNSSELSGIRFVPTRFIPESSKFQGKQCGGVHLIITNRSKLQPLRLGFEFARQLRSLYLQKWETANYNRLLSNRKTLEAVLRGKEVDEIEIVYRPELRTFKKRRSAFLLYD